jgi:hypothetical protein
MKICKKTAIKTGVVKIIVSSSLELREEDKKSGGG